LTIARLNTVDTSESCSGILGTINTLRDAVGTAFWLLGAKGFPLRPHLMR
jgi:hypothetical protein